MVHSMLNTNSHMGRTMLTILTLNYLQDIPWPVSGSLLVVTDCELPGYLPVGGTGAGDPPALGWDLPSWSECGPCCCWPPCAPKTFVFVKHYNDISKAMRWSSVMRVAASNMQVAYSVCEVFYKEPMASVKIVKSDVFLYIVRNEIQWCANTNYLNVS